MPSRRNYVVRPQSPPRCCCLHSISKVTGRDIYPPQLQDRLAASEICRPQAAESQTLPAVNDPVGRWVAHPYHQAWRFRGLYSFLLVAMLLGTGIAYLIIRHRNLYKGAVDHNYARAVYAAELMGFIAVVSYALHIIVKPWPFDPTVPDAAPSQPYNIRVLIPCYTEDTAMVLDTARAALQAWTPPGCTKTVYLCNDNKDDQARHVRKQGMAEMGGQYMARPKGRAGDGNPKSANLNWCLNQIYSPHILAGRRIPANEVISILDADHKVASEFFKALTPLFDRGDDVAMVLTPQFFRNVKHGHDIFNHVNSAFWYLMQPTFAVLGLISCTGTNFMIRAEAWQEVDGFPEHTVTEDFAMGIELTLRRWCCIFVPSALAIGEAPETTRKVFQQRSRWAKGHWQIFWSPLYNPLLRFLPWPARWHYGLLPNLRMLLIGFWYCGGIVSYSAAAIGAPFVTIIPVVNLWAGIFPLVITKPIAILGTLYLLAANGVIFYSPAELGGNLWFRIRMLWLANTSNLILNFTYLKAALLALWRAILCKNLEFKATGEVVMPGKRSRARHFCSFQWWSIREDLWFSMVGYAFSLVTIVLSIGAIIGTKANHQPFDTTLGICLGWAVYAAIAPCLVLTYVFWHSIGFHKVASWILREHPQWKGAI
ncbi:hypothetical protein WJX84_003052 [Apatococcus fuscideae]|uniref:Glycosyltransferase 2-like domain-containing protein n=1 Tax=Apatococcus fuscideae TaxID=2026836 RepID=A0AAW1RK67_9CHLO